MRLSKEYYLLFHPRNAADQVEPDLHLSADLLWVAIKRELPLDADQAEHALRCRDCREFVEQFSAEAREAGFSFPDLMPELKRPAFA